MTTPDFTSLNKHNALAFFNAYMAEKESGLALLQNFCTQHSPTPLTLDFSEASLDPLWEVVRDHLHSADTHPTDVPLPLWYDWAMRLNPYKPKPITASTAWLVHGLSYYMGDVVIRYVPDTHWGIDPYPKCDLYCNPMVRSELVSFYPIYTLCGAAAYANIKPRHENDYRLVNLLHYIQQEERDYRAFYIKNGNQHNDPRVKKKTIFK